MAATSKNENKTKRPESGNHKRQRERLNKEIWPAQMRYRENVGSWFFYITLDKKTTRKSVGSDFAVACAQVRRLAAAYTGQDIDTSAGRQYTLADWWEQWRVEKSSSASRTTTEGYDYYWQALPDPIKAMSLTAITREDCAQGVKTIAKPSMADHAAALLSTLLSAAQKAKLISASPWQHGSQRSKRRLAPLSASDRLAIVTASSPRVQPALALAAWCGLRRGEIMALTKADVDLQRHQVSITKARVRRFGKYDCDFVKSTKTGNERTVPIPQAARPFIEPVFAAMVSHGQRLYETFPTDIPKRLASAYKKSGVKQAMHRPTHGDDWPQAPDITLHDLRHLAGTLVAQAVGPHAAQALLGHTTISTTMDVYGHLQPVYLLKAMDIADGDLGQGSTDSAEIVQKLADLATDAERVLASPDAAAADLARRLLEIIAQSCTHKKTAT